jgi:hypothetical protein
MRLTLALILTAALAGPTLAEKPAKPGKGKPAHAVGLHCPPGLAKKNPPCVPPGLARADRDDDWHGYRVGDRILDDYVWLRDPWRYGIADPGTYWRVGDMVFRVDGETGEVLAVLGALAALLD